jgi:hypothetical protein
MKGRRQMLCASEDILSLLIAGKIILNCRMLAQTLSLKIELNERDTDSYALARVKFETQTKQ